MEIKCDSASLIRLDLFLSTALGISRSQIPNLIKNKLITINGNIAKKAGILVKENDIIKVDKLESSKQDSTFCIDFDIEIIYEDDDILVINKPPYIATHGATSLKESSLVDWLKANNKQLSNISGEKREGIVHRLDKQTSGAMVIAKNNISHSSLSLQLQNKTMGRFYIAIIDAPLKSDIVIECNLARNPKNRLKISKQTNGRYSKSNFYKLLLSKDSKKELILAKLYTGRTHQIRAHLESINRHIVGDSLYGYKGENLRVMLHSYFLYLEHLKNGKMSFRANIFDDMNSYLENNFDMEMVGEILKNISFSNFSNSL